jgi:CRP-like cAMP-binding protein
MESELKKMLHEEAGMEMSDELFERFVGSMTEIRLKNREVLIPYGKIDTNLYVQKNGVLRACYVDDGNERTYGFSNPGTVILSYHSHWKRRAAVFQIESCDETTVLKMTKNQLDELLDSSLEFAKWLLATQIHQLFGYESKAVAVTGSAKKRYLWILENRPEYVERVPSQMIASYLGIAPEHFYRLKKSIK